MLGLKFHQKNFYQDIYHFIIDLINDPQNSEEIFRKNMSELLFYCGKTDRNNGLFRSVPAPKKKDQEFADDDLTKTIKEILLNYAYQDIKWTFAGTTLSLTDISKDNLANNNIKYEDLLPVELKNKNKRKTDENKIYIYPDGSFSVDQYKKVKITYKDLADSSGFNWEKGYSFENKVRNKNWKAGFNSQGSWEIGDSNKNSIQKSNYIFPSVIKDNDNFTFLIISDEKKKENEAILFDNNSVLLNGSERKFYDKDHKLSKVEKIDIDKSLDKIKDFFKKNGLDKITGIVVNKINNKIIKNVKEDSK